MAIIMGLANGILAMAMAMTVALAMAMTMAMAMTVAVAMATAMVGLNGHCPRLGLWRHDHDHAAMAITLPTGW